MRTFFFLKTKKFHADAVRHKVWILRKSLGAKSFFTFIYWKLVAQK